MAIIKKKKNIGIDSGIVHVNASFNNTLVTITNDKGDTIDWLNAGKCGFKGSKKSSNVACGKVAEETTKLLRELGIKNLKLIVKGVGPGRDYLLRALGDIAKDVNVYSLEDATAIPHNGCRPPKKRK